MYAAMFRSRARTPSGDGDASAASCQQGGNRHPPHERRERLLHEIPHTFIFVHVRQPRGVGIIDPAERSRTESPRRRRRSGPCVSERDTHARSRSPALLPLEAEPTRRLGHDTAKPESVEQPRRGIRRVRWIARAPERFERTPRRGGQESRVRVTRPGRLEASLERALILSAASRCSPKARTALSMSPPSSPTVTSGFRPGQLARRDEERPHPVAGVRRGGCRPGVPHPRGRRERRDRALDRAPREAPHARARAGA